MKLIYHNMAVFFTFSPTSNHLHPLQDENCDSNSRLVVDEDNNVKSGLKGLGVNPSPADHDNSRFISFYKQIK